MYIYNTYIFMTKQFPSVSFILHSIGLTTIHTQQIPSKSNIEDKQ